MPIMRHAAILTVALLVSLNCAAASVQWKWRDSAGRVNASDLPPPASVPERDILQRPIEVRTRASSPPPSAGVSAAASVQGASAVLSTDPELEARRKRAADEKSAQLQQQKERQEAVRADNCSRNRSQLAALSDGRRVARANAQGETEILDDKARAEEIQRARAIIASDC
jgi:hypothetical protein